VPEASCAFQLSLGSVFPSWTKEKVEVEIRSYLFTRFTLRDWTEDKLLLSLSHRSRKAPDILQQVRSGIPWSTLPCQGESWPCSRLPTGMQPGQFHKQRLEQPGEGLSCQPGTALWLPRQAETNTTDTARRCDAGRDRFCQRHSPLQQGYFEVSLLSPAMSLGFQDAVSTCQVRSKPSHRLICSLWMNTSIPFPYINLVLSVLIQKW